MGKLPQLFVPAVRLSTVGRRAALAFPVTDSLVHVIDLFGHYLLTVSAYTCTLTVPGSPLWFLKAEAA